MFFFITITYPWIFSSHIQDELVLHQGYFHIWDASTVQFILWGIYLYLAPKRDKKYDRVIGFEEWKEQVREEYKKKDHFKADLNRKLLHLAPPALVISMFYMGYWLEGITMAGVEWDHYALAVFWAINVGFGFEFVMITADLVRLNKFHRIGQFARNWANKSIIPKELDTFTSANGMVLAFIPFYFAPFRVIFSLVVISAVSDAAASLVGKKFGKQRNPNDPKTWEGYIAGAVATYIVVIGMNALIQVTEPAIPPIQIHVMGIVAGIAFFLVDRFVRKISDNFLNPVATGLAMLLVLALF